MRVLYEIDDDGLLLRPRAPDVPNRRFHLTRTTSGNRWLISASLPPEERAHLHEALAAEPVLESLELMEWREPAVFRGREDVYRGPAFAFPEHIPDTREVTETLRDTKDAASVPQLAWIREASPDEHPLAVARNNAGEIVAVCHSARLTVEAAEAGVETAVEYRGRGYGAAVVAAWAAAVRADGRLPLYSTRWSNTASRGIARKLHLAQYGEDNSCA